MRRTPIHIAIMAALFWALSPQKSFDAPQYILMPVFLVFAMLTKVANGWMGGTIMILALLGGVAPDAGWFLYPPL